MNAVALLRPHAGSFVAVVILQIVGSVAGLAPLLAVVELGRVLLSPGPVDHGRAWIVVAARCCPVANASACRLHARC
ncbi:hypothetical protein [Fodinicola acaciae]|uniref:hypothetical protein n=1 Tax=Fodinicola acaciae TaxID=2681555 RepID=UPI0013D18CBC|nr:hypothetical protein [Fodinicola acaciae]